MLGGSTSRTNKALLWTLFAIRASAHTWIEQAQVIGANGSYVGDYGYARGFVDRADFRFDGYANKWQTPDPRLDVGVTRMDKTMLMCHPSQRIANYSSDYPRLQVVAGDFVALKYLENGHVTRRGAPKANRSMVGLSGPMQLTSQSKMRSCTTCYNGTPAVVLGTAVDGLWLAKTLTTADAT